MKHSRCHVEAGALALLLLAGCGGGSDETPASVTPPSSPPPADNSPAPAPTLSRAPVDGAYEGYFYNIGAKAGGTVVASFASTDATAFAGPWNFTGDADVAVTLCGAGPTQFSLGATQAAGQFTSNDTDTGCGFDHGAIFTLDGVVRAAGASLDGGYGARNAQGSSIGEGQGIYEIWRRGSIPVLSCTGEATRPAGNGWVAVRLPLTMSWTLGQRMLHGRFAVPNVVPTTGVVVDCRTEFSATGARDPLTGAIEYRLADLGRTGSQCSSTTGPDSILRGLWQGEGRFSATGVTGTGPQLTISVSCPAP